MAAGEDDQHRPPAADRWGIEGTYVDVTGREHEVPTSTVAHLRSRIGEPAPVVARPLVLRAGQEVATEPGELRLEDGSIIVLGGSLPSDLPIGYHTLETVAGRRPVIVSPGRCAVPSGRKWGWAVQLYGARSQASWGIGDLGDLGFLSNWASGMGAGAVMVSPLGAVSPTTPQQPSPYYPSSRRFLNPLYLRVEEVPGASALGDRLEEQARAGRALNADPSIDRDRIWQLKATALEAIWRARPPADGLDEWLQSQGAELTVFADWCVLAETHGDDWRSWPAGVRRPDGNEIAAMRSGAADRIRYHKWLQWLCRRQLASASEPVMLFQDLPIGFDPSGADAWQWQDLIASDVTIGAPPDEFNRRGQTWDIPPFVPHLLQDAGYEPFAQTIRSGLLPGGGLRIDHVMGLFRLFWIPDGADPKDGAYVRYPASDLLDIVALESTRAGATVVGEDLGTVAPGVRDELARRRMLSYRLLHFEKDHPRSWPELSLATVTTHDLPTVAGIWSGADLAEQEELDMEPSLDSTYRMRSRIADLPGLAPEADLADVVVTVHGRLAEAPSVVVCATLEDLALMEKRPNIPGSEPDRPNWSIPLPVPIEDLTSSPLADRLGAILGATGRDQSTADAAI